jgi:cyclophilin family peptidyl-prolyl cis-trans isomerase
MGGTGAGSPATLKLADESFALKHDEEGVIAMANKPLERNSASTQFYITLNALPWLDGRNVVFGRVVEGARTSGACALTSQRSFKLPKVAVTLNGVKFIR